MKNVFENFNVPTNLNEQFKQITDMQARGLEPFRAFAALASDTVELYARKNYEVAGDVLESTIKQVNLPLSSDNLADVSAAQAAEANALVELMNGRAAEYAEMAQQFSTKAKEASENFSASYK